ncbi:hypothetical protein [Hylemonella gracilis]|uniref:Uncharacterized protein n=1 Tax=Hylemonella gracilis ATCC 19624 TaxID=887062 RepID=F3KUP2_9BURK|nr:hypothetical protein [Hylemonella gracilis]EGI76522.1 hypothetical protein HGR_10882 [Hylemonella gracilis ATCC 19624]
MLGESSLVSKGIRKLELPCPSLDFLEAVWLCQAFVAALTLFEHIDRFMHKGRVKIADLRFEGRVIIEPSGVGAGQRATDR